MADYNHPAHNQQHLAFLRQQEALVQVQDLEQHRLHPQVNRSDRPDSAQVQQAVHLQAALEAHLIRMRRQT